MGNEGNQNSFFFPGFHIRNPVFLFYQFTWKKSCGPRGLSHATEKEEEMPVIHVHMFEGRTLDQKRKLVASMTEAVVKSLDAKPETVQILIHENSKNNVSVAGVLHSEKK
jgi:4-oxalocrotonate tautomerase